ncbi:MAG: hypothetical protein M4579_003706 [Chaenotheca gracillima]|nr:MAG: hypothetical protein M4579_003706 [Chaenotheca gracillima]
MSHLVRLVSALLVAAAVAQPGPSCSVDQVRAQGAPYMSDDIAAALLATVATPKNGLCSGSWPQLNDGSRSNSIRRSNGSLILHATRHDKQQHRGQECIDAFSSIIHVCIGQALYWGGNLTANKVDYAVYNDAYPKNWVPDVPSPPHASKSKPGRIPNVTRHSTPPKPKPTKGRPVPTVHSTHRGRVSTNSSHPVKAPSTATHASFKTQTLKGVTGKPGSYSQTSTTDSGGHSTVLPIWFGAAGVGVVVVPVGVVAAGVVPPPPPGLPPVHIGPDGDALPDATPDDAPDDSHDDHTPTHGPSHTPSASHSSPASRSSTRASSSSSSSAASTASAAPYIIRPKDGLAAANDALTADLKRALGSELVIVSNAVNGVLLWSAPLTPSQVTHYKAQPQVSSVKVDGTVEFEEDSPDPAPPRRRGNPTDELESLADIEKRDFLEIQTGARWDLVAVSFPIGHVMDPDRAAYNRFVYDGTAGSGSTIYVLDSGANVDNPDFKGMRGTQRWLYVRGIPGADYLPNARTDSTGHGSCVLSKAAGGKWGVAKRADVVIVRFPQHRNGRTPLHISNLLSALNLILDDVIKTKRKKNVVVISWRVDNAMAMEDYLTFRRIFTELTRLGVIVSVAAGNSADITPDIDHFPATLASDFPFLIVGAVDSSGKTADFSQGGSLLTVAAPGQFVLCAARTGQGSRIASGTSYAAPLAGGLAAYFLSLQKHQQQLFGDSPGSDLSDVPYNMKKLMQSLAYKRGAGTLPVIWNGVNWLGPAKAPCVEDVSLTIAPLDTSMPTADLANRPPPVRVGSAPHNYKRSACTLSRAEASPTPSNPAKLTAEAEISTISLGLEAISCAASSHSGCPSPFATPKTSIPPKPAATDPLEGPNPVLSSPLRSLFNLS